MRLLRGRLSRKKYFAYFLSIFFVAFCLQMCLNSFLSHSIKVDITILSEEYSFPLVYLLANVGYFIIDIKRFHDLNMSGWNYFTTFIPLYNLYILWKLLFVRGTKGLNRFGDDPMFKEFKSQQKPWHYWQ